MNLADIPVFPKEMMALLGIEHPNTLRLKIKRGEIPEPDVRLTQKNRYWFRSTLIARGLLPPDQASASPPTTAE